MSRGAWLYIALILTAGAGVAGVSLPDLAQPWSVWATWAALTVLTMLALFFRAVFQTKHESDTGTTAYSPVLVFLLAGVLLLPLPLLVLQVIVSHLAQWARERWAHTANLPAWYIQPFNMAVYILAGAGAGAIAGGLQAGPPVGLAPQPIVAALLVILTFLLLNTLLIGEVLVLARGVTWRDTQVLNPENLLPDLLMLVLGYVVAYLWLQSPWLSLMALMPLALISRALMVPQLKKEAQTDGKTGLANARHFAHLFAAELERALAFNRPLAVLMADLDFLRNINNAYGHLAGDVVLAGVGRIIRETVGAHDIAARFGGEEFAILLPETEAPAAVALGERLRQTVAATPFVVATSPTPIYVTMSIGVACYPHDAQTQATLLHAADIAVYQAKLSGRDRVVCVTDIPHSTQLEQMLGIEARLFDEALPAMPAAGAAPAVVDIEAGSRRLHHTADGADGVPAPAALGSPPQAPAAEIAPAGAAPPARPARALGLYVGGVIAAGAIVAALGLALQPLNNLTALLVFAVLAAFLELFQINIYGPATTSASVAAIFAAALVDGVPGVLGVGAVIALVHYLRQRPRLYKSAFNLATYVLAGSAVVVIMAVMAVPLTVDNLVWLLLPTAVAALAQYVLNTGLVAGAVALAAGERPTRIWRQQFQWLAGHYLVLGLLGFMLALAYGLVGPIGAVLFILPVVIMRYAQEQYVDRTRDSMQELTRMNRELGQANQEIVSASRAIGQLNDELFLTLSRILDARDPYVAGHSAQVSAYATATGQALGLPAERLATLRQAGFLHDIGKIAIPETLLHKPARLTPEEYEHMKMHVVIGADFLSASHALRHLAPFVRHHHERWDGRGYPDGLAADTIPLESRILSVCDAVEAMASDRPYQVGKTPREIVAELQRCRGSQFDPAVCDAFIGLVERYGDHFVVNSAREVMRKKARVHELVYPIGEHLPEAVAQRAG